MPSYPTQICTLDDVHSQLSIPAGDTSADDILMGYILAATSYVNFVSGTILPQQFTEYHSGGGPTIVLYNSPILTVDSIVVMVAQTPYTLTEAEIGSGTFGQYCYAIGDPFQGVISRVMNGMITAFEPGTRNVAVTYTAGQTTVPADVKLAVLMDIQVLYQQTQYGADQSSPQTGEDYTVTPINAFPRLANMLTGSRRVQALA